MTKEIRVKLIKTLNQQDMPIGITGFVVGGKFPEYGMVRVKWDNGHTIPMYCDEIEEV